MKPVRYQNGSLFNDHGAWFVRYRIDVRQPDGSMKVERLAERLGDLDDLTRVEAEGMRAAFMRKVNAAYASPQPGMSLSEFVLMFYLPWVEAELRASTLKGYRDIWNRYLAERVGDIRLFKFRTVDASRVLREIASEFDLTKTTLQHIKSVLSGIFTHAKNEGAYEGGNPVFNAKIPRNAREPGETFAYNLVQILRILDLLPLLPKAVVAMASFAGLREGELCGLEWPDFTGDELSVLRSIWRTVVNGPKTRASAQPVPVIATLAEILDRYRASMQNPKIGVIFHHGNGQPMDMDKLAQRVIRPIVEGAGLPWYGWHGFRRGIASNLYALGASDKVVQRILRHAKPHIAKERYIKAFDPDVLAAMQRMQAVVSGLGRGVASSWPACEMRGVVVNCSQ